MISNQYRKLVSLIVLLFVITSSFACLSASAGETTVLAQEEKSIAAQVAELSSQLDETNTALEETQNAIVALEQQKTEYQGAMKERIQYFYENNSGSFLVLLLEAKSLSEFNNTVTFLKEISEYDNAILQELEDTTSDLYAKQAELQQLQTELTATKEDLEETHGLLLSSYQSTAAISASVDDVTLLAALIECEAGSTDYAGLLAVGACVINRVKSASYPNTISEVIYASGQFAPVWEGKLARVLERGASSLCYIAAQDAINGATNIGDLKNFRSQATTLHTGVVVGGNVFF